MEPVPVNRFPGAEGIGNPGQVSNAEQQPPRSRLQIDSPDAGIRRHQHIIVGVRRDRVPGFRPQPAEVRRHRPPAIVAHRLNGARHGPSFARLHIEDVGDELVALAVVIDHRGIGTRQPLQHAALLPTEGLALGERKPAVIVLQIDHSERDAVVESRQPIFEVSLHSENVAIGRVKLQVVVVAEPVELGSARQSLRGPLSGSGKRGAPAGGQDPWKIASIHASSP